MAERLTRNEGTRLAYVDPQSYRNLAKYDVSYLRGLREAGFRGRIRFYSSSLLDRPAPDDIEVRPLFRYNRKRSAIAKLGSYAASMARLSLEALRRPADVYHFQWVKFAPLDLLILSLLRRLAGARVVLTAHNVVPHGEERSRHRSLGRIYRAVDRIVVHHTSTAEEIGRRFSVDASRFTVLPHGLTDLEPCGTPRHQEKVARFAADHEVRFCFFGRGSRYKGLDLLLRAWRGVSARMQGKAGLIVMGALDAELRALAGRAVEESSDSLLLIDEAVEETDLFHAVTRCDAVVLPHRRISQSGALMSVLGLRVPVVVSNIPGLLEPLEIGPVGWSFDGSERGLAERLVFLAERPEVVSEARRNQRAWEAISAHYAWKRIADRAIELYEGLATAR
jgi:D-inositol-3-phosphate glycosyltransferase